MTVYDLIYLLVDDGLQTVRIYDYFTEDFIFIGKGDELPDDIRECEVMSIDCLPHRSSKNEFDEGGYGILTINVEKGGE